MSSAIDTFALTLNVSSHFPHTIGINAIIRINNVSKALRRAMAPRKKSTASRVGKVTKIVTKGFTAPESHLPTALPPLRAHHASYHYPFLLDDKAACDALLSWFEGVEETRSMPWRKKWIDPQEFAGRDEELGKVLGKRAYEVWVSEVSKYKIAGASDIHVQIRCHLLCSNEQR